LPRAIDFQRELFSGDSPLIHNHLRTLPKCALNFLAFGLLTSAAMIAGCDSSADPNTTEAKKQIQASREQMQKEEEKINADMKKNKAGKNAPKLHNIKGMKTPAE
jgi:hypothetical protein